MDLETLLQLANDPEQKADAVEPLGRILLSSDDGDAMAYRNRRQAAEALGKIGDPRALATLLIGLQDHHSAVRTTVADSLGKLGDARAVDALLDTLQDENETVRTAALNALQNLDHTQYMPIIERLADTSDAIRTQTFNALKTAGKRAMPDLIRAMMNPNSTIRGSVADLLGELADESTRAVLKEASKQDESRWVRSRAEEALKKLPPEQFDYPRIKRNEYPGLQTNNPIDQMRARQAGKSQEPQTEEDIQKLLDQLDLRLLNGEISEETYKRLAARWESKLKGE